MINFEDKFLETWYMHAILSSNVYNANPKDGLKGPWNYWNDCPPEMQKHGYFGRFYWGEVWDSNHQVLYLYLVIAHRGTDGFQSTWEDFLYWLNDTAPKQIAMAQQFTEYAITVTEKQTGRSRYNSNFIIRFTGHSLGALLAESCHLNYVGKTANLKTRTFESPGLNQAMLENLLSNSKLTKTNLADTDALMCPADVDAINTCYPHHIGTVVQPTYFGYTYSPDFFGVYPLNPGLVYYFLHFTLSQHHIKNFVDYWARFPQAVAELSSTPAAPFSWPVGIEQSLNYWQNYFPYNQKSHADYWNGYMPLCWNTNALVRDEYDNDYQKFMNYFINNILKHNLSAQAQLTYYTFLTDGNLFFTSKIKTVPEENNKEEVDQNCFKNCIIL